MPQKESNFYDIEIEENLLLYILNKKEDYEKIFEFINNDYNYFYDDKLRTLYICMFNLFQKNEDVNYYTMKEEIEKDNIKVILKQFKKKDSNIVDLDGRLETLENKKLAREFVNIIKNSHQILNQTNKPIPEVIEQVQQKIFDIDKTQRDTVDKKSLIMRASNDLEKAWEEGIDRSKYIFTHYAKLDKIFSGIPKGKFCLIAARPSIGKTAFAINLADRIVEQGKKAVLFYSLEMTAYQVFQRIISLKSKTNYDDRRRGRNYLTKKEYKRADNVMARIHKKDYKLEVSQESGLTPALIKAKTRRQIKRHNIDVVFIDFIQLMRDNNYSASEYQKVTDIVRELQDIAKDLNVLIIALSQLSRKVEDRNNKYPQLSDLRDSGAIEEAGDIIMMLYREDYYKMNTKDNKLDIFIRKNRDGKTGRCSLQYDKNYNLITD